MSMLSKLFAGQLNKWKRQAREWCRNPASVSLILAYPAVAAWMHKQEPLVQSKVRQAVPLILEAMADKWFGG